MTKQEWLSSTDPKAMLEHLQQIEGISGRKWRLVAVASCRQNFSRLLKGSSRWKAIDVVLTTALEHVERHADGQLDYETLLQLLQSLRKTSPELAKKTSVFPEWLNWAALRSPNEAACSMDWPLTRKSHAELLLCLFGNTFHTTSIDAAWLTPKLVNEAEQIYDQRAFDRLPVLADELEVAGCAEADILTHCRQPGPHVRGCWPVDLILGKS